MGNVGPACYLQHFSGALACLPEYAQIQPEHMVRPPSSPVAFLTFAMDQEGFLAKGRQYSAGAGRLDEETPPRCLPTVL